MERDNNNITDHDLLIELRTEMKGMREDIKRMSDTNDRTIKDHEDRIRMVEEKIQALPLVVKLVYGEVALILVTVLGAIIYQVVHQ